LENTVPSLFPFWGGYTFFDLALSNTLFTTDINRELYTSKEKFKAITTETARWKDLQIDLKDWFINGDQFLHSLQNKKQDVIILHNLSSLALLESTELEEIAGDHSKEIIKIAVENIPIDIYVAERKYLIEVVGDYLGPYNKEPGFITRLFSEVLHTTFDNMVDVTGKALFQNNINQLFEGNLRIIGENEQTTLPKNFARIPSHPEKDTIITAQGWVKNSVFSSGSRIEGYVENSVIFSDVHIREDARVIDSVVMNANKIGKGAAVEKSLLFPAYQENLAGTPTIGEKSSIGSLKSRAQNRDYPKQIQSGLTVIGTNPDIPQNVRIEGGCFIDVNTPASEVKKTKHVRSGTSVHGGSGSKR
jgi:ADP-glucose pyrophosphorylase